MALKAYLFDEPKGAYKAIDIPDEFLPDARKIQETMVEDIAESDEALMEKYLMRENSARKN